MNPPGRWRRLFGRMAHWRGLGVTLGGSTAAIAASGWVLAKARWAVGGVMFAAGDMAGSSSIGVGVGIAGLVTAGGGILIQVYDRSNARRRIELDHSYRLEIARLGCRDLREYSQAAYKYIQSVEEKCVEAGVVLPSGPGPPPDHPCLVDTGEEHSDGPCSARPPRAAGS